LNPTINRIRLSPSVVRSGIQRLANPTICYGVLILFGIALRLRKYLFNRSLWLDEARMALNVLDRSYIGFLQPLEHNQVSPPGFMILEKAVVQILGDSEFALRLLPLLFSVLMLILFPFFARRFLSPAATAVSLTLLSVSDLLVEYASEVKSYSGDATITLLLLLMAMRIHDRDRTIGRTLLCGLLGTVAIWFSITAAFVLAGIAIGEFLFKVIEKRWKELKHDLVCFAIWGLSIGLFFIIIGRSSRSTFMLDYWGAHFMPIWPINTRMVDWLITAYINLFKEVGGLTIYSGSALLFLIGCVALMYENRRGLALLCFPILMALAASAFQIYPFKERLLLFLAPIILLLVAKGVDFILRGAGNYRTLMGIVVASILIAQPLRVARWRALHPFELEEMRPVVGFLKDNYQDGDALYVYYGAQYAFDYYKDRLGFDGGDYTVGIRSRENPESYLDDVSRMSPSSRVWFLFSHDYFASSVKGEAGYILAHLDCIGEKVDDHRVIGASLHLYDLSEEAASRASVENEQCRP
jgi:hypothetical protein